MIDQIRLQHNQQMEEVFRLELLLRRNPQYNLSKSYKLPMVRLIQFHVMVVLKSLTAKVEVQPFRTIIESGTGLGIALIVYY